MASPLKNIIVTGDVAYDILMKYEGVFDDSLRKAEGQRISAWFISPQCQRAFGGNASNIAWGMGLLGLHPMLASATGSDGKDLTTFLEKGGVDLRYMDTHTDCMTATSYICTDTDGNQILFFHPGANERRRWPDIADIAASVGCVVIAPSKPHVSLEILRDCKAKGIPCFLDIGPKAVMYTEDELREAMDLSAGAWLNEYEAQLLLSRLGTSAEALVRPGTFVIITHGEKGFTVYEHGKKTTLPCCKAQRVADPTGAGDAFRSGFVAGWILGWDLPTSGKLGAALASFVVEQEGAMVETLSIDELYHRAKEAYGADLPPLTTHK